MEYVITFESTNLAIKSEKILTEKAVGKSVMPLPSQIRSGCGICLRVGKESIEAAEKHLKNAGIKCEIFEQINGTFTKKKEQDR